MRRIMWVSVFHEKTRDGNVMPSPVGEDISRVECVRIQGIRVADVVGYLKVLITQKTGALGLPEGVENKKT